FDRRLCMKRVGRTDENRLHPALLDHGRNVAVRTGAKPPGECLGAAQITVTDRDEFRLGQSAERLGLDLADLATTNQGGTDSVHRLTREKYVSPIRRRKASDSA